jgi:hypothetical protein
MLILPLEDNQEHPHGLEQFRAVTRRIREGAVGSPRLTAMRSPLAQDNPSLPLSPEYRQRDSGTSKVDEISSSRGQPGDHPHPAHRAE